MPEMIVDSAPLPVGAQLMGRFVVTRWVAGGGMARVYEAREVLRDGTVRTRALKELRPDARAGSPDEARQLFESEARILAQLSHPNLPEVSAFFQQGGRHYLVMEFVRGESLAARLEAAHAPLLEGQVLEWAVQICDALAYLHERPQPIIFRDLKPSNVMVTPEGIIKLVDFGIARVFEAGKDHDTLTMGSENYAAPEQWGGAQTDPRADLYGLGATLYHLLSNHPPLPAHVPDARTHVPGAQTPLRQLNPALSEALMAAVERAMQPEREARYGSATEMRTALLACLPPRERLRLRAPAPGQARPQVVASLPAAPASERRHCSACGAQLRAGARFCHLCGRPVASAEPLWRLAPLDGATCEIALVRPITRVGRRGGAQPVDADLEPFDPQGYVSRNHATLAVRAGAVEIVDLGSANGTFVNGQRLAPHQPRRLMAGDRVRLSRLEFELRADAHP